MLINKLNKYISVLVCLIFTLGIILPISSLADTNAETLITSFEEKNSYELLVSRNICKGSGKISLSSNPEYVSHGAQSIKMLPTDKDGVDYDTSLTVSFDEGIKKAYGITFKVYNADSQISAALRCFMTAGKTVAYQYISTVSAVEGWQTVTIMFDDIGKIGTDEFFGGTTSGSAMKYDQICGITALKIRAPYIGKTHAGLYFDEFRYVYQDESTDVTTIEKQLVGFDEYDVGKNPTLSSGFELISDPKQYQGTKSIIQVTDLKKSYNIKMDKSVATNIKDTVADRPSYIAFKVALPEKYAAYLDEIKLDITNNKTTGTAKKEAMYYLIGISDNSNYGKSTLKADELFQGQNGIISVKANGMYRVDKNSFLGTCSATSPKWTQRHLAEVAEILIYVTLPSCKGTEGWSVTLNSISVSLTGDRETLEHIDDTDPYIAGFDESEDMEDLKKLGTFKTVDGENNKGLWGSFSLSDDAQSPHNALKFKALQTATNYQSQLLISLDKRVSSCYGVQFYVKNLNQETAVGLRCFLTSDSKEFQYTATVDADQDEYVRIRIFFDNVGLRTGDDFWGGTTSGTTMTADEIKSLTVLRIRLPYIYSDHDGVIFDSFSYITVDDRPRPEDLIVRMLDFDDCAVGGELPDNVKLTSKYKGSSGVVEKADKSKTYQLNYDVASEKSGNKINDFDYIGITVNIPKGTLKNAKSIKVSFTNNAISCDKTFSNPTNIYQVISVSGGGFYGKNNENADKFPDVGSSVLSNASLSSMKRATGVASIVNWCGSKGVYTKKQLADVSAITVYITVPSCNGDEGWNVQLNSIDVEYNDLPQSSEESTRYLIKSNRLSTAGSDFDVAPITIARNDPNYKLFSSAWNIKAKNVAAAEPVVFENSYTNFYCDARKFVDTATIGFYISSDSPLNLSLGFIDSGGKIMRTTVEIKSDEISGIYTAYSIPFKEVYEAYKADNPDSDFDISDIRKISVLPQAVAGHSFNSLLIGGLSVWSREVGSAVTYFGYHYADNGAMIDAYNDSLSMDTKTVIVNENISNLMSDWNVNFGAGAEVITIKTITLYSPLGAIIEPNDNIWIGFEVDPKLNFSDVGLYRIFFDGSAIKQRYVVEDNYISLNTFSVGTFAVVRGVKEKTAGNKTVLPSIDVNNVKQPAVPAVNQTDTRETADTQSKIIRKMVVKKKKSAGSGSFSAWVYIAGIGGAFLLAGGSITAVILVRRRRKKGGKA